MRPKRANERIAILAMALAIDLLWGEPPEPVHPVVWIGRLIGGLEERAASSPRHPSEETPAGGAAPTTSQNCPIGSNSPGRRERPEGARKSGRGLLSGRPAAEFTAGLAIVGATIVCAAGSAILLERLAGRMPWLLRVAVVAVALKPLLAVRALFAAVADVERPLLRGDIPAARAAAARIVSRDVSTLDSPLLAAAAIESLAENLSDSVVAPCCAFLLGGLPLAAAYRAANTLDAMLGYRGAKEYLGKPAAKLDDVLNLVPSRLAAALLVAASPAVGASPRRVALAAWGDRRRTASPNAGWPMSAVAAALGRCLEKRGHYRLYPAGSEPVPHDVRRARRLAAGALVLAGLLAALAGGLPPALEQVSVRKTAAATAPSAGQWRR